MVRQQLKSYIKQTSEKKKSLFLEAPKFASAEEK